jgi:hypothetical protein
MLSLAFEPPPELLTLPYTVNQPQPSRMFVSLLLRPVICPEIPGVAPYKSMEIRFFAPGNLVSNLDFVETVFGNGGNPSLPEYDASLDVEHWSGHTGCVVLAPHLVNLSKRELGLPHWDVASERQRRDGMCWQQAGRTLQQWPGIQAHRARCQRRHGHHPGRQLLRLLQEGSQNPDQLRRQSVWPGGRRTCRRRAAVPVPQSRRGIRRRQPHPGGRAIRSRTCWRAMASSCA